MSKKTTVKHNQTIPETVRWIKRLAVEGSKTPAIRRITETVNNKQAPQKEVFDIAYSSLVYEPDYAVCQCGWKDYLNKTDNGDCPRCGREATIVQSLRHVENILREKKGNCTAYSILQSALLIALNQPVTLRVAGYDPDSRDYEHIYIVSNGIIMDPVIGQRQDGTDTFHNRPANGQFDKEKRYVVKKDYLINRLDILQGTRSELVRKGSLSQSGNIGFLKDVMTWRPKGKAAGFFSDIVKQAVYPIYSSINSVTLRPNTVEWSTKAGEWTGKINVVLPQEISIVAGKTFVNSFTGGLADNLADKYIREPLWGTGRYANQPGAIKTPDGQIPLFMEQQNPVQSGIGTNFMPLLIAAGAYLLIED